MLEIGFLLANTHHHKLGDVNKASAKVKGELPGRVKEAEKEGEKYGAQAGAKFDSAVSKICILPAIIPTIVLPRSEDMPGYSDASEQQVNTANKEFSKAKADAEAYAKGVKADARKKIDEIDRKVEDGAAKTKSGISSWWGGK